jgi:hypothetical protein
MSLTVLSPFFFPISLISRARLKVFVDNRDYSILPNQQAEDSNSIVEQTAMGPKTGVRLS